MAPFAEQDLSLFLGEDLITWLVLAFGGALFVGNIAAIVRPPRRGDDEGSRPGGRAAGRRAGADRGGEADALEEAPVGRALVMAGIGLIAAIWALASLLRC